jgi:hypothetical protein
MLDPKAELSESIQIGDTLISIELKIIILDYNPDSDEFIVDIFNRDGKLIDLHRTLDGQVVRACFRKRE